MVGHAVYCIICLMITDHMITFSYHHYLTSNILVCHCHTHLSYAHTHRTNTKQTHTKCTHTQVEGRVVVDMTTAATTAVTDATIGQAEEVAAEGMKSEEPLLLKKMEGILNDYAGNGEGTATIGGETEKK